MGHHPYAAIIFIEGNVPILHQLQNHIIYNPKTYAHHGLSWLYKVGSHFSINDQKVSATANYQAFRSR
jgi:hypothetical protein